MLMDRYHSLKKKDITIIVKHPESFTDYKYMVISLLGTYPNILSSI